MTAAKLLMSAAASAVLAGTADAQFLRAPAAAPGGLTSAPAGVLNGVAPPPPLGVGVGPGAQLPGGMNTIWSRLGISQEQREFCRRKICRTPAGQLLGRIQAPISTLTGGIIPPFCPIVPSIAELLDPGAIGAASKAKLDRAGAEERIKAVKYLGTLDCHYWPEAEDALIGALRGDRNECVRYEAAVALARGCCCTCKVIVALSHVVSCSDKDGFPYEKSARVRAVAAHALDRCLSSACLSCGDLPCLPGVDAVETPIKEKEKGLEQGKDKDKKDDEKDKEKKSFKLGDPEYPKEYYAKVARMSRQKLGDFGQKALEIGANIGYQVVGEVNARDYAAAGLNTSRDGQSVGAKPTTIWELMTWKDSGATIGNPLMGPPAAYSGVPTPAPTPTPVRQVVQPIPAFSPSTAMPPAMLTSRPRVSAPVVQETLVEVPAVSLPSAMTSPKPLPQPLTVPTLPPPPVPAKLAAPKPVVVPQVPAKPVVMAPLPAPVPAKPVAVAMPAPKPVAVAMPAPKPVVMAPAPVPAPKPVAVTPAPQKFPAVMQPTMAAPTASAPAIVLPKVEVKVAPVVTAPALPPVEKLTPTVDVPVERIAPQADLPPVEKFSPGK